MANGDFAPMAAASPHAYEEAGKALLGSLKPKYRLPFVLREIEGWDYSEIAAELGVSELEVRARVVGTNRTTQATPIPRFCGTNAVEWL